MHDFPHSEKGVKICGTHFENEGSRRSIVFIDSGISYGFISFLQLLYMVHGSPSWSICTCVFTPVDENIHLYTNSTEKAELCPRPR